MSISASEALRRRHDAGRIKNIESRLLPFVKPVFQPEFAITAKSQVFCIGSCFARNVERALEAARVRVVSSEFSVPSSEYSGSPANSILNKYTPPAIWQELKLNSELAARGVKKVAYEDIEHILYETPDGRVIDGQLSGFRPVARERALSRRQEIYELFCRIGTCDVIILTLGLIECWYDRSRDIYIQQAPTNRLDKYLADIEFRQLDFSTCLALIGSAVEHLLSLQPSLQLVITTSPVVLARTFTSDDIIIANNLSKSTLRAVAGAVASQGRVTYFPSYEMATLSRGVAVYESDHSHIRDDFVRKIISYFVDQSGDASVKAQFHFTNELAAMASAEQHAKLLDRVREVPVDILADEIVFLAARAAAVLGAKSDLEHFEVAAMERSARERSGVVTQAAAVAFNQWLIETPSDKRFSEIALRNGKVGLEVLDDTYLRRARRLMKCQDLTNALPLAERALVAMPESEIAILSVGKCLSDLGQKSEALTVLSKLDQISPTMPAGLRLRAVLLGERGDIPLALDAARRALALKEGDEATIKLVRKLESAHGTFVRQPNPALDWLLSVIRQLKQVFTTLSSWRP